MRALRAHRKVRVGMRLSAGACFVLAGVAWLGMGAASAAVTAGPTKTAWYDRSGAQNVTGETTPSPAQPGELEVSYVPAAATAPEQTIPPAPSVPGAPVAPPSGNVGGSTLGYTVAFAAVEYSLPLEVGGQSVDPSSITGTLTLALDQASSGNVANGDLLACPTNTTLWSAGGDQDAGQAPPYSCADAVSGNVDSAGHTVSFALTSAQESQLSPGTFSLVIVPGSTPAGAFQAVFSPPGDTSLAVTGESPLGNANDNLDNGLAGGTDQGSSGDFGLQSFSPAPDSGAGSVVGPAATAPVPAASSGPAGSRGGTADALGARAALRGGIGSNAQRTVALVVLLALGTLLVAASSRPGRSPRSLRTMLRRPAATTG